MATTPARGGVLSPRLAPLLAALATVAAVLWWAENHLGLDQLARLPAGTLVAYQGDSAGHIGDTLAVLRQRPPRPALVLLGGSAMRNLSPPRPAGEEMARHLLGPEALYLDLASNTQSMADSLAILDGAVLAPGSVAVVHANLQRFLYGATPALATAPALPFQPQAPVAALLAQFGHHPKPVRNLVRYSSFLQYYLTHRLYNLSVQRCLKGGWRRAEGCATIVSHAWQPITYDFQEKRANEDPATWNTGILAYRQQARELYPQSRAFDVAALTALAENARSRGIRVVLADVPLSRAHELADLEYETQHREDIAIARRAGAGYVDFRSRPDFTDDAFRDFGHVNQQGRARFVPVLADSLSRLVGRGP